MSAKKIKDKHNKREERAQNEVLGQSVQYEKRVYDLEQLLDIAKSFCSELNLHNLLESIVYICMAQMHVLGAQIFVRDLLTNEGFSLETAKEEYEGEEKEIVEIPYDSPIVKTLQELDHPVTFEELKQTVKNQKILSVFEKMNPTLIIPLAQNTHLNGILVLQERIAIEEDTSYTDYEKNQMMMIASLASVAINNASLLEKSSVDMMTHLKLKYFFFNRLAEVIDTAFTKKENPSVLMFDIDFFKKFNDTYGHECGDYVLITVADIIKKNLRESDIASRYGGEEFTVLLNKAPKEEAMLVAERIRSSIEKYDFVYNDQHLHVTISGGVSVFDSETNLVLSPQVFVDQADQALYKAKNSGRNKIMFFEPNET